MSDAPLLTAEMAHWMVNDKLVWDVLTPEQTAALRAIASGATRVVPAGAPAASAGPVAWALRDQGGGIYKPRLKREELSCYTEESIVPLYVAPPAQPAPAEQAGWRDIASAPHNKAVLIWQAGWLEGGEATWIWDDDDGHAPEKEVGWYFANTYPTDACGPDRQYPTHWMPLPESPK